MSTEYTFRKICAKRIREVREKTGETRKEFAARLSVAPSTYAKYETAETQPTFSTLVQIADIGNVSTDYLLGRTNAKEMQFSILDDLGLTEESAQVLAYLHDKEGMGDLSDIVNFIIGDDLFKQLIFYVSRYLCLKSKPFNSNNFHAAYAKFKENKEYLLCQYAYDAGFVEGEVPVILTDSHMAAQMYRYEAVEIFNTIICDLERDCVDIDFFGWDWGHSYGEAIIEPDDDPYSDLPF